MSFHQNAPWTPAEKVDLLVNVLRSTIPDLPLFLMQVLNEKGIYPKWNDTPLPAGRSLASSQIIYEEMGRPFKQQGPYNVQPVGIAHVPAIAPALPNRRPYTEYEPYNPQQSQQQQQQRTLQPRPPRSTDSPIPSVPNGEGSNVMRSATVNESASEPPRKKRGRPSKEEAEERDRALAAEGKVYQPKKRPVKKIRPSLETPLSVRTGDFTPLAIQTPPTQTLEMTEEEASEKRRVKRQVPEESGHAEESSEEKIEPPPPVPQSPSDRLLATHRERDLDMLLTKETPKSPSRDPPRAEEKG